MCGGVEMSGLELMAYGLDRERGKGLFMDGLYRLGD